MLLLNQQAIVQASAAAYDPGMMTFDGSTGYYTNDWTASGNRLTFVARFKIDGFTGTSTQKVIFNAVNSGALFFACAVFSDDFSITERQGKCYALVWDAFGAITTYFLSTVVVTDNTEHTVYFSYNGDFGDAAFYIDGVDVDDTGFASRVAPSIAVLYTGTSTLLVGINRDFSSDRYWDGDIGYIGFRQAYLTNPTDFYHPTNGLQEIDETGWTEWGAQPLFWNQYGQMTDNKGSAGNMTANGTITGPA